MELALEAQDLASIVFTPTVERVSPSMDGRDNDHLTLTVDPDLRRGSDHWKGLAFSLSFIGAFVDTTAGDTVEPCDSGRENLQRSELQCH